MQVRHPPTPAPAGAAGGDVRLSAGASHARAGTGGGVYVTGGAGVSNNTHISPTPYP